MRRLPLFLIALTLILVIFPVRAPSQLFDSYLVDSDDGGDTLTVNGQGAGQCFNATFTGNIVAAQLKARKVGSPVGNAKLRIYPGAGTFGSSCIGDLVPIAESKAFDISTLAVTTTIVAVLFESVNQIVLTLNVTYVVSFDLVTCTNCDGSNNVNIRFDNTAPGHAGNSLTHSFDAPPNWSAQSSQDRYFSVEGLPLGQLPTTTEACGATDTPACAIIGFQGYLGGGVFGGLMAFIAVFGFISVPLLWLSRTWDSNGDFKGFALPPEVLIVLGIVLLISFSTIGVLPIYVPVIIIVIFAWLFAQTMWGGNGNQI